MRPALQQRAVQRAETVRPIGLAVPRLARVPLPSPPRPSALENERTLALVLMLPTLVVLGLFIAYPFVMGVALALSSASVGSPGRFVGVGWRGASMRHGTVRARPRAHLAENHERRRAVVPALADVGALGFLAHGVELQLPHEVPQPCVVRRPGRAHLQPFGFGRPGSRHERNQVAHSVDYSGDAMRAADRPSKAGSPGRSPAIR